MTTNPAAEATREFLDQLIAERDELRAENERLRAALEKHHDLLSDEPGDICRTCDLDYLGNHRLPTNT